MPVDDTFELAVIISVAETRALISDVRVGNIDSAVVDDCTAVASVV